MIGITGLVGVLLRYVGPVTIVPAIFLIGIYLMKATAKFAKVHWGISFMYVLRYFPFAVIDLILYAPVNNTSVISGRVLLG